LSQGALAELARISKKTIARIEAGKVKPHFNSTKKIASALKVQASDLAKESSDLEKLQGEVDSGGTRRVGAHVSRQTDLAFQLVEHLYGISERDQIRMAPMFAALLAEASLKWRRDNLDALEAARDQVRSLCSGHLSIALGARELNVSLSRHMEEKDSIGEDSIGEIAEIERHSIESRDIYGLNYTDCFQVTDGSAEDFYPFADFLQGFAAHTETELAEFFDGPLTFDYEGLPEYQIALTAFEDFTGGECWAEYALMHGYARIRDIPWQIRLSGTAARAEWLAARVPPEERARVEAESVTNTKLAGIDVASHGLE
jgi:DNA-binding XRE family transcriptional regulator